MQRCRCAHVLRQSPHTPPVCGDPAMHRTYVDLSQAVNHNLQDSTRQSQALDNELSQRQTQEQMQTQQSMSR